jgi:hypothetical protein
LSKPTKSTGFSVTNFSSARTAPCLHKCLFKEHVFLAKLKAKFPMTSRVIDLTERLASKARTLEKPIKLPKRNEKAAADNTMYRDCVIIIHAWVET